MAQLGFLLDQRYCIGCQGCETACQARNNSPVGISLRTAESFEERSTAPFLTSSCAHCENPSCIPACPVSAISKNEENGIVTTDYATCIGCKACISACPYGAPKYDEESNVSMKCDFCADRLAAGENPACVDGCPVKVLTYGEIAELEAFPRGTVSTSTGGFPDTENKAAVRFVN